MGVDAPVVVGGIIPEEDRPQLAAAGVAAVYTPKDFDISRIMSEIADLAALTRRARLMSSNVSRRRIGGHASPRPGATIAALGNENVVANGTK